MIPDRLLREMLEDHEDHLTDQLDYRFEKKDKQARLPISS